MPGRLVRGRVEREPEGQSHLPARNQAPAGELSIRPCGRCMGRGLHGEPGLDAAKDLLALAVTAE